MFHTGNSGSWNDLIGRLMEKQEDKSPLADFESGEILLHLMNQVINGVMDREMAVRESEKKLRFTIKPVDQIIVESGLKDVVTMQRKFRENENMSAEEYRMKWAHGLNNGDLLWEKGLA